MNSGQILFRVLLAAGINLGVICHKSIAQSKVANPLQTKVDSSDPLIPTGYGKRELSSFEVYRLQREINRLDRTAKEELQQGKGDRAFELWYRQLKLARAINPEVEIKTLGEVGAIAWSENRTLDLRNIANRLMTIEQELTQENLSPKLLDPLATAYQQVRYLEQAIAIEQQILKHSRQQKDLVAVQEQLQILGKLYVAQFNYPSGIKTYQELLTLAEAASSSAPSAQINEYLNILSDLYERTGQTKLAITTRKRLIKNYTESQQLDQVPRLELAIAHNYATLRQTNQAQKAYYQAFTLASATQQLAIANDALDSLGKLYLEEQQYQKAIAIFRQLLTSQSQSYDHYGLINTYDQLGKIYAQLNQKKSAKSCFQQAKALAEDLTLDYKVEYFNRQLAKFK